MELDTCDPAPEILLDQRILSQFVLLLGRSPDVTSGLCSFPLYPVCISESKYRRIGTNGEC